MRSGIVVAVRVVAALYLAVLVGLFACAHAPSLVGWDPRVVVSGSMEPVIRTGDVAVVSPVTPGPATLPVGQVVLVIDPSRPSGYYLHRLVRYEGDRLVTRGDANAVDDWPEIDPSHVAGRLRLVVPAVGLPLVWWRERDWLLLALAAVLTWAAIVLAAGLAVRRSTRAPAHGW